MKRLTARQFRATFATLTEPVIVNGGVWVPADPASQAATVIAMLEGEPVPVHAVSVHAIKGDMAYISDPLADGRARIEVNDDGTGDTLAGPFRMPKGATPFVLREARASVALDHDSEMGTQSMPPTHLDATAPPPGQGKATLETRPLTQEEQQEVARAATREAQRRRDEMLRRMSGEKPKKGGGEG